MSVSPDLLSVIITTSPIPSHPSTEIMDKCLSSLFEQPTLVTVPIFIVCDGVQVSPKN